MDLAQVKAAYSFRGYQDSALQIGGEPVEVWPRSAWP
jgi:hypothetical protein